jgi:hypothetical protein
MLKFNSIQFLKDFHIRYSVSGPNVSQGWIGTSCPFCRDHSDHLGIHLQTSAMSCWRCGRHSNVEYVTIVLGIPRSEAKSIYSRYLTKVLHHNNANVTVQYASYVALPDPVFTNIEELYLDKRMLTSYHKKTYDLRGGGIIGEWAFRIVIPICYNEMIVSATGRNIFDVKPKYYSLDPSKSIMNLKHLFLGMDLIPKETVIVVEGPIDAIRGGPGFVASFGSNLSDEQLLLLREYDTIYFIRDSDRAGDNFVKEAYNLSSICTKSIEVIKLEGYKDVGEMPEDEIVDLRKELMLA